MTETESHGERRKKEIPLVTWQQKRPRDGIYQGKPFTWVAIRENPDKPQQIQGWRRVLKVVERLSPLVQPIDEERVQSWKGAVSPEDAAEERMREVINNQQDQSPKTEEEK